MTPLEDVLDSQRFCLVVRSQQCVCELHVRSYHGVQCSQVTVRNAKRVHQAMLVSLHRLRHAVATALVYGRQLIGQSPHATSYKFRESAHCGHSQWNGRQSKPTVI